MISNKQKNPEPSDTPPKQQKGVPEPPALTKNQNIILKDPSHLTKCNQKFRRKNEMLLR